MNTKLKILAGIAAFLLFSAEINAATVNVNGTNITGISGVVASSGTYDITFSKTDSIKTSNRAALNDATLIQAIHEALFTLGEEKYNSFSLDGSKAGARSIYYVIDANPKDAKKFDVRGTLPASYGTHDADKGEILPAVPESELKKWIVNEFVITVIATPASNSH